MLGKNLLEVLHFYDLLKLSRIEHLSSLTWMAVGLLNADVLEEPHH